VVATLSGPGGTQITLANEAESPGVHTLTWNGTNGGSLAPEGKWTFSVTGTDDRNITTTATRPFSLDDTLSSLAVQSGSGSATAIFELTRSATVLVQVERLTGVPVATLRSGKLVAGPERLTWKGKSGGRGAPSGRYQVAVQATSSVGTSTLVAPFSFRAHKH
jgi:flagellar hook assembly protein FlgD